MDQSEVELKHQLYDPFDRENSRSGLGLPDWETLGRRRSTVFTMLFRTLVQPWLDS